MTGEWKLRVCGEFCGVMADGQVKPADRSDQAHWSVDAGATVSAVAARNGWLSLRAIVEGRGEFSIRCDVDGIECDLFREFYHGMAEQDVRLPDALVPIQAGQHLAIPSPDEACEAQRVQGIWIDLFVPRDAAVGVHAGRIVLTAGGAAQTVDVAVDVLELAYPDEDCIQMDHNCYGHAWLTRQYPNVVPAGGDEAQWDAMIPLIHKYHAMCFEHHGLFHQLGTTHSGAAYELYNPRVAGRGRDMHVVDWTWYDRHIGPLLDGAAFAGGRRNPAPIPAIYTAYTPSWPADYLGWGHKGYEVELTNVLRDHDAHLRERGWTRTVQEFFFNHKKRYHAFAWDGDEPRFATTNEYWRTYRRILDAAVGDSPVPWKLRMDCSWRMHLSFEELAGVVDFWVCSTWADFWKEGIQAGPMARGDMVWSYGPTVALDDCTAGLNQYVYRTWVRGFGGFERWLTTGVPDHPWLASDGAPLAWFYPGERFGIEGPIPTIRLKIQRNAVQDINLMNMVAQARGEDAYKAEIAKAIPIRLWKEPSQAMLDKEPYDWDPDVDVPMGHEPDEQRLQAVEPQWWLPIRQRVRDEAQEVHRG